MQRHLSQLISQIIWPHWVRWGLIWKVEHSSRSLWNTQGAVSGYAGSVEGDGHLKLTAWVRGRGIGEPEGKCRVNRNQKDMADPVGTRQELITRGNYCLAHSWWHRILKHQQNMPGMLQDTSRAQPTASKCSWLWDRKGWDRQGLRTTSPDLTVNLVLRSTWDARVKGWPL